MKYTKDNFPEVSSFPNTPLTILFYGLFSLLAMVFLLSVFALPLSFQLQDGDGLGLAAILFNLVYYPGMLWGIWAIAKYYRKARRTKVQRISVDKHGVNYHLADGTVETIFYKQLERSTEAYISDIDRKTGLRYSPGYIFGFINGKRKRIDFYRKSNGLGYIPQSKYQLIGHFLQGITLFRPDLKISKSVFSEYYINPRTFEYDKAGFRNTVITVVVAIILILLAIDLFTKFTKGYSLLF